MWPEISESKMSKSLRMCVSNSYLYSARALTMLLIFAPVAFASDPGTSRQARVKDISSIEGIRDNQLVGYGIVVGLQGTGDSQQTTFPECSSIVDSRTKFGRSLCLGNVTSLRTLWY